MSWITSVCCSTAENCWAKPSTVSPNNPTWLMGASRKHVLSTSFISIRLSQRWCSCTTMVDIAFTRDRAVTFDARREQLLHQPRVDTTLVHLIESLGLVNLQDSNGMQGRVCLARSTISFGCEHRCTVTTLSTWGIHAYPLAAQPSRVVRTEETDDRLLAVKGAIHDFVSSSCTSGNLTAARAIMAVSSGSGAAVVTTPEGPALLHLYPQRT